MTKWEYLFLYHYEGLSGWQWLPSAFEDKEESEVLNHVGALGWELVAVTSNSVWKPAADLKSPGSIYILKRIEE